MLQKNKDTKVVNRQLAVYYRTQDSSNQQIILKSIETNQLITKIN